MTDHRRFPVDFDHVASREELRLEVMNAREWERLCIARHGMDHPETDRARRVLREALERYGTPIGVPASEPRTKLIEHVPHERSCMATFAILFGGYGIDPEDAARHVRGEGARS
jgi:hypothetical protein